MAVLTARARKALPAGDFAGPGRSYPDQDRAHGADALSRVASKNPALKARVRAAVHRKYPGIGQPGLINR